MCLKSYIFRKTYGFAQIAQKKCARLRFRFMRNFRKKYFRFCANCAKKIAQNSLRFMGKNSAKVRKKKFARKYRKFCSKDLAISWKPYV